MNSPDNEHNNKPNKNSLNLLAYYGKRNFDIRFLALYMFGGASIWATTNFILDGGDMSAFEWWLWAVGGVLFGIGLYFWDLNNARKKE